MRTHLKSYSVNGQTYHYFRPSRAMLDAGVRPVRLDADRVQEHLEEMTALGLSVVSGEAAAAAAIRQAALHKHARSLVRSAKHRAAVRNLPMQLTTDDIATRLEVCDFRCEVTGIPFDLTLGRDRWRGPFRPSLDRIDSRLGYTVENFRLVCVVVNAALGEWGDIVFWQMVQAARDHRDQNKR